MEMQELGRREEVEMESDATNAGKLNTRVQEHNCGMRCPCDVCGRWFEPENHCIVMLFCDDELLGDVCPDCAEAGREGAAQRAREHAERLRKYAESLERLAVELPGTEEWATIEDLRAAAHEAELAMRKLESDSKDQTADTTLDPFAEVDPFADEEPVFERKPEEPVKPVKPVSIDIDAWVSDAIRLFPQIEDIHLEGIREFECDQSYSYYELLVGLEDDCYDGDSVQVDKIEQRLAFHPALRSEEVVVYFLRPKGELAHWAFAHDDDASRAELEGTIEWEWLKSGALPYGVDDFWKEIKYGKVLYNRERGQMPYPGEKQAWLKSAERLGEELFEAIGRFAANDTAATVESAREAVQSVLDRLPSYSGESLVAVTSQGGSLQSEI